MTKPSIKVVRVDADEKDVASKLLLMLQLCSQDLASQVITRYRETIIYCLTDKRDDSLYGEVVYGLIPYIINRLIQCAPDGHYFGVGKNDPDWYGFYPDESVEE